MNLSSSVLPSIRYKTGAGSQLSIDIHQPTNHRIISGRFRLRPKSQYGQKLLNAALIHTDSRMVTSQSQQSFSIGGVKVLSRKFGQLSASSGNISARETQSDHEVTDRRYSPSHLESSKACEFSNRSSPTGVIAREKNAVNTIHKNNMNSNLKKGKDAGNSISSISQQINVGKARNAILNARNNSRANKNAKVKFRRNSNTSLHRKSVDIGNGKPDFTTSNAKAIKVFLSQKQSADISAADKGTGTSHPSAPPCTPSLEMLQKFDYIPSLSDNMAKQQVKTKLKIMKKVEIERDKIKQADRMKLEAKEAKEREQELKRQQRRAIYALNAVMTKVENEQFERFKSSQGLKLKEYPSYGKNK